MFVKLQKQVTKWRGNRLDAVKDGEAARGDQAVPTQPRKLSPA